MPGSVHQNKHQIVRFLSQTFQNTKVIHLLFSKRSGGRSGTWSLNKMRQFPLENAAKDPLTKTAIHRVYCELHVQATTDNQAKSRCACRCVENCKIDKCLFLEPSFAQTHIKRDKLAEATFPSNFNSPRKEQLHPQFNNVESGTHPWESQGQWFHPTRQNGGGELRH